MIQPRFGRKRGRSCCGDEPRGEGGAPSPVRRSSRPPLAGGITLSSSRGSCSPGGIGHTWRLPVRPLRATTDEFRDGGRSFFSNGKRPEETQMTSETHTDRSRWIALYVLCVGVLMIVLDATVVNVALPSVQDDLGFSTSSLAWVVNAYLIAFGGLLLLAGRLGDLIGRRTVFLAGLTVFTGASLLCGVAQSQALLVGARFLQGIGGAMTSGVILGIIVTMFPEPPEHANAIGVYGFVASAGGSGALPAGRVPPPA